MTTSVSSLKNISYEFCKNFNMELGVLSVFQLKVRFEVSKLDVYLWNALNIGNRYAKSPDLLPFQNTGLWKAIFS